jgi:hypothetical protein
VGVNFSNYAGLVHYDGGAYKHDPSFATSQGLATTGFVAASLALPVGSLSAGSRSVFYSGQGALGAARAGKGTSLLLEDTIGGKVLNYIDQNIYRFPGKFWKLPSAVFALNAKGFVKAFLRNPSAGSVWNTVERPIVYNMNRIIVMK